MSDLTGLDRGDVHLWTCWTKDAVQTDWPARHFGLLSAAERTRHDRYVFEKDRNQFLIGRILLRKTLSRYAAELPEAWSFQTNELDKPEITAAQNRRQLRFNLSHCEGLVLCGLTIGCDIGVDCERADRNVDIKRLASRVFSTRERDYIDSLPVSKQAESFFRFWTLKESYVKARGQGMSLQLKEVSFEIGAASDIQASFGPEIQDGSENWQFIQPPISSAYATAVAVNMPAAAKLNFKLFDIIKGELKY